MECNSLVYRFCNGTHEIFKIQSVQKTYCICFKQGKFPLSYSETNLQWNKVGAYRLGSLSNVPLKLKYSEIQGKVLNVDNILLTCPNNVLIEK